MAYDNKNSGAIFVNDRQREGKQDPDRSGEINVVCPHCKQASEHWLSGWLKEKNGKKYMSLALKPKDAKGASTSGGNQKKADF